MKDLNLRNIIMQASEEIKLWPAWMQQPEMRNIYDESLKEHQQIRRETSYTDEEIEIYGPNFKKKRNSR